MTSLLRLGVTVLFLRLVLLPIAFAPFRATPGLGQTACFVAGGPRARAPHQAPGGPAARHRAAVRTCRSAAATLPPGYWPSAEEGRLSPADFIKRHLMRAVGRAEIERDLQVMLWRARGGFPAARQFMQGTPALETPTALPAPAVTYTFEARDDPMIIVYGKNGELLSERHYTGPAVMLFFDESGRLSHIDFVGVCDCFGRNRQSPHADYVGEHARLHVQTGTWKFRDGCGKRVAEVSDREWDSEKQPHWRPSPKWLDAFSGGKTFVLHAYQPRVIEGPRFDHMWSMAAAPELYQLAFDRGAADEWMNAMLVLVGSAQLQGLKWDAEELLRYAVLYGMAMTRVGQHLPAPAYR